VDLYVHLIAYSQLIKLWLSQQRSPSAIHVTFHGDWLRVTTKGGELANGVLLVDILYNFEQTFDHC
jgi:hypothetical protein